MLIMDISKIIRKSYLEQFEICYIIEQYIKEMKGVNVKVEPDLRNSFLPFAAKEFNLMINAYNKSCEYFFNKGY